VKASRPPAEAPMPTIGKREVGSTWSSEAGVVSSMVGRARMHEAASKAPVFYPTIGVRIGSGLKRVVGDRRGRAAARHRASSVISFRPGSGAGPHHLSMVTTPEEAVVHAHFLNSCGVGDWWATEGSREEDDFIIFGSCDLGFPEPGSVSPNELESVRGPSGLGIERWIVWLSIEATCLDLTRDAPSAVALPSVEVIRKVDWSDAPLLRASRDRCPSCIDRRRSGPRRHSRPPSRQRRHSA
jgi:hypothetical protein